MPDSETFKLYARNVVFLKVLGFRAISIVDGKSVTKPLDILFFALSVALGVFIAYLTVINRKSLAISQSEIANYGNFITILSSICVSIIAMVFSFIFRHKLWNVIVCFADVDEKVNLTLT